VTGDHGQGHGHGHGQVSSLRLSSSAPILSIMNDQQFESLNTLDHPGCYSDTLDHPTYLILDDLLAAMA
jgi:hypothetical protein